MRRRSPQKTIDGRVAAHRRAQECRSTRSSHDDVAVCDFLVRDVWRTNVRVGTN